MNWEMFCTVLGTGVGLVAFIYTIMVNFKKELKQEIETHDKRMIQLAMGKRIKEILLEEIENKQKKGK